MEICFESCSAFTRLEEGGYVNDPRDSGNWTSGRVGQGTLIGSNMGVGAPTLLAWMGPGARITAEQMCKLPLSTYEAIARCRYWLPLQCGTLPAGLDLMIFDFGWNRGVQKALDVLKRCLGEVASHTGVRGAATTDPLRVQREPEQLLEGMPAADVQVLQQALGIRVDGIAGPRTVAALNARQDLGVMAAILALSVAQVESYRSLANFPIYGAGWLARSARRKAASLAAAQRAIAAATRTGVAA